MIRLSTCLFLLFNIAFSNKLPVFAEICQNETFVISDGAKLFCRTMGKGKPLIVLHGGPGLTQDYLLPKMAQLSEDYFVIFYDQRCCGRSEGELNPQTINIETFTADIEAIRKAFILDKISLLGHSWGGFLAMQYAINYPNQVDKLILSNTMPATSIDYALFKEEWGRRTEPYRMKLREIKENAKFLEGEPDLVEEYYRLIFRTYCYLPEKADELNLRLTSLAAINGAKVSEIMNQNLIQTYFNLNPALQQLNIPTLIIHGDVDPIPPVVGDHLHENIKGSQYLLIKNCGHFPYVEKPDEFFAEVKNFLG